MKDSTRAVTDALKRTAIFLGITIAALFITLLPFIVRGNYLVLCDDGVRQHATFLEYMFGKNIFGGVGEYDYNIGLGGDYEISFSYYMLFDPVNLLLFILPRKNFLLAYSFLITVKFLLTAVFMYIYLNSRGVRYTLSIVFSIAYMLGGFMIFTYVRHPDLAAGAMFVPLVTLGLEKAIDKKPPFLLIISVFLLTLSSFYMIFMVTVYAVPYAAFYYVYGMRKNGRKITAKAFCAVFFRTAAMYIAGLLMAAFLLFPAAYGYLTASRGTSKGMTIFGFLDIASIVASFIMPVTGLSYSPIMFTPFVVLLALSAVAAPEKTAHKAMSVILTVCVFLPFVGYAMNMFNYVNNRYVYLLSFSVFSMSALHVNDCSDRAFRSVNLMVKGSAFIIALLVDTGLLACLELFGSDFGIGVKVALYIVAVACIILSAFVLNKIYKKSFVTVNAIKILNYRHLVISIAVVAIAAATCHNVQYSEIYDDGTLYAALNSEAEYEVSRIMAEDDEFFRMDTVTHGSWGDSQNRPLNNDYRGTMTYNTMAAGATGDFTASNSIVSFLNNLGMAGVNGRSALQALLAAKYYRTEGDEYVPRQYTATETPDLYVTDRYIGFGTVFDAKMSEEQYNALPVAERQYAMLDAVVVADAEEIDYSPIVVDRTETDGGLSFSVPIGESKTIEISDESASELYVLFTIENEVDSRTYFSVSCGKTRIDQFINKKGNQMYSGLSTFLFKLDESGKSITFGTGKGNILEKGETLHYKDVKVLTADYAAVLDRITAATEHPHLTDTKFDGNGFGGKINSDGGTMFIPLNYSDGWSAYVDGKKTEIQKANIGFMSIDISKGEHVVEFEYETPYFGAGMIVSCVAAATVLIMFCVYTVIDIKRKKQEKADA